MKRVRNLIIISLRITGVFIYVTVRNALAHKSEEVSFVSKVLLANADAICAPVVPTFDDNSLA